MKLLENPPRQRPHGFDLNTNEPADIVHGLLRRTVSPKDKLLELWRDGTLIFAAQGNERFLCWPPALDGKQRDPLGINAIALIESAYDFADLTKRVYAHAEPFPARIEIVCEIRNLERRKPSRIAIVGPDGFFYHYGSAPASGYRWTIRVNLNTEDTGEITFRIAASVFEWYGLEHEKIPFQIEQGVIHPSLFVKA